MRLNSSSRRGKERAMKEIVSEIEYYMRRAIALARKGAGSVSPNPMVGAVIVKDGIVIGEGFHEKAGFDHAEIIAIKKAGKGCKGASLYVNLEPCCHYGKTPPCTDAIIRAGIEKVYIGMVDPNPIVSGKGIEELRKHGIHVKTGILEDSCRMLNEFFIKYITTGIPFVIIKMACSMDGRVATFTGDSRWISCEKSRIYVHKLRSSVDAIIVGVETVIRDDPELNVRLVRSKRYPMRIIVDSHLRTPLNARIFYSEGGRCIIASVYGEGEKERRLSEMGVEVIRVDGREDGRVSIRSLLTILGKRGLNSVLIEGGPEVCWSAIEEGVVDKVMFFYSPIIIGGKGAPGPIGGIGFRKLEEALKLKNVKIKKMGEDFLFEGYLKF